MVKKKPLPAQGLFRVRSTLTYRPAAEAEACVEIGVSRLAEAAWFCSLNLPTRISSSDAVSASVRDASCVSLARDVVLRAALATFEMLPTISPAR